MTANDRIEIETLLPFYANRTLDADERRRVDTALSADENLRAEASALERIRQTLQAEQTDHSPGEFGLARLMRDIEREKTQSTPVRNYRSLMAASVVAAAVALGGLIYVQQGEDTYRQASGGDAQSQRLTVAFRQDATERDISGLLIEYGLEIVEGPSAIGLYRLDPGANGDIEALLSELDARSDVIESIEME